MTDREKIREEVARIQAYTQSDVLKEILDYIDKVQEEPKFKTGDHIKPIDSSLGAPRTILKVCDGWYVTNQGTLDFEFEDNWELAEEPVSEDLEEAAKSYSNNLDNICGSIGKQTRNAFKAGTQWQKEQMLKQSVNGKVIARFPLASDPFYDDVEIYLNFTKGLSEGDKVKIVIIKED